MGSGDRPGGRPRRAGASSRGEKKEAGAAHRAMWRAVVTFGPVSVPVKMYAGLQSRRIQFHLLHDKDKQPLRQVMVNPRRNEPVDPDHVVWGYPLGEDEYVILTAEELAALEPEAGRVIEVSSFVDRGEIDARYFDRPYFLGPDDDAGAFAALLRGLERTGKLGVCRWLLRKRSYVGVLGAVGSALSLVTLRTAEEVVPEDELKVSKAELREKEMKTAKYLIDELSGPWTPGSYHDEYEAKLRELIARRAKGERVSLGRVIRKEPTKAGDLLRKLQESVRHVQLGG